MTVICESLPRFGSNRFAYQRFSQRIKLSLHVTSRVLSLQDFLNIYRALEECGATRHSAWRQNKITFAILIKSAEQSMASGSIEQVWGQSNTGYPASKVLVLSGLFLPQRTDTKGLFCLAHHGLDDARHDKTGEPRWKQPRALDNYAFKTARGYTRRAQQSGKTRRPTRSSKWQKVMPGFQGSQRFAKAKASNTATKVVYVFSAAGCKGGRSYWGRQAENISAFDLIGRRVCPLSPLDPAPYRSRPTQSGVYQLRPLSPRRKRKASRDLSAVGTAGEPARQREKSSDR
ncbi:hypothetical protein RRG08_054875 [Elysia crispata]|uniref:Uncharacterized protein n=1 Tax=Elysia crispata TaxID=231223 RepID=A0AAE1A6H1_9GAST|nr:hypothetical protein RRG08_054875 [Elysia crispata]